MTTSIPSAAEKRGIITAIRSDEINYDQLLTVAQSLPCYIRMISACHPGTAKVLSADLSDCSSARLAVGDQPLDSSAAFLGKYFPSKMESVQYIPPDCLTCNVFGPAWIALAKLQPST